MDPSTSRKKRLAWYFKKNAVILTVILLFLVLVFFVAMGSANVYIVVMEGMEARASVVMNGGDTSELGLYFTDYFIKNDPLLNSGKYEDYVIGRYTYVSTPNIPICLPFQAVITVKCSEWVGNIDGELSQDKIAEANAKTRVPPEWDNGVYAVTLVYTDGKWKIADVQLQTLVKEETDSAQNP